LNRRTCSNLATLPFPGLLLPYPHLLAKYLLDLIPKLLKSLPTLIANTQSDTLFNIFRAQHSPKVPIMKYFRKKSKKGRNEYTAGDSQPLLDLLAPLKRTLKVTTTTLVEELSQNEELAQTVETSTRVSQKKPWSQESYSRTPY
jgi:hypothetical protein